MMDGGERLAAAFSGAQTPEKHPLLTDTYTAAKAARVACWDGNDFLPKEDSPLRLCLRPTARPAHSTAWLDVQLPGRRQEQCLSVSGFPGKRE